MTALRQPLMTAEEFVDWPGNGQPGKDILVNGVNKAMDPSSGTHGNVQATLAHLFLRHLKATGSRCRVATELGMRPRLNHRMSARGPDLAVTCGPRAAGPEKRLLDPVFMCEVLSPGNDDDPKEPLAFGSGDTFTLTSISVSLGLDEVYGDTRFGPL